MQTPKFKSFIYEYEGRLIRERLKDIDTEKEAYALKELQHEVEREMRNMERGRALLQEARVMILPSWDISSAIVFEIFLKRKNKTLQIMNEASDRVYIGSGYNPDNTTLQIWALYPPGKKSSLIDHDHIFGHLLVQRVGG